MKDKLEELYKNILNNKDVNGLLHKICPFKDMCWKQNDLNFENKCNSLPFAYIGERNYKKLLCIGLNLNQWGGNNALYELIDFDCGVKKELLKGKVRLRFGNDKKKYCGTFLFHRMAVYANIILRKTCFAANDVISISSKTNIFWDREALSNIMYELSFTEGIKCSPLTKLSKPINGMYDVCPKKFLFKEIELIQPNNILIFDKKIYEGINRDFLGINEKQYQKIKTNYIKINGQNINIFYIIHPQARGGCNKKIANELQNIIDNN